MGRAERRRRERDIAKSGIDPKTYEMILARAKAEVADEVVAKALTMFMCVSTIVLHDEYKFGEMRANNFLDKTITLINENHKDKKALDAMIKKAKGITNRKMDWRDQFVEKWGREVD